MYQSSLLSLVSSLMVVMVDGRYSMPWIPDSRSFKVGVGSRKEC